MANIVTTNNFRQLLASQQISLSGDAFAVSLLNIHVQSASDATLRQTIYWSEVSVYEASAVGYSAMPLTASTIATNTSDSVYWDGTNIVWSTVTLSPYGYCIYRISDGIIVGFVEFDSAPLIAINGSISIVWNDGGIMDIFG